MVIRLSVRTTNPSCCFTFRGIFQSPLAVVFRDLGCLGVLVLIDKFFLKSPFRKRLIKKRLLGKDFNRIYEVR